MEDFQSPLRLDYAIAQSIFSHCGTDLIEQWLSQVSPHMKDTGALFATFLAATEDSKECGWIYPGCVKYRPETLSALAATAGFEFRLLDWAHPRQSWALFSKRNYDGSLIAGGTVSWNRCVAKTLGRSSPLLPPLWIAAPDVSAFFGSGNEPVSD